MAAAVVVAGGVAAAVGRAVGGTSAPRRPAAAKSLPGGRVRRDHDDHAPPARAHRRHHRSTTTSATGADRRGPPSARHPVCRSGVRPTFTDPATGDPALVIQQTAGDFVAFDAVCPHAGCTVAYQRSARIIACPCHGSEFDARTGDVIGARPPGASPPIPVIKGANGDLYVAEVIVRTVDNRGRPRMTARRTRFRDRSGTMPVCRR